MWWNLIALVCLRYIALFLADIVRNENNSWNDSEDPASFFLSFFMHFFPGTKHPREDNPNLYY